jgi:hypothetical protein
VLVKVECSIEISSYALGAYFVIIWRIFVFDDGFFSVDFYEGFHIRKYVVEMQQHHRFFSSVLRLFAGRGPVSLY